MFSTMIEKCYVIIVANNHSIGGVLRGVVANVLDYDAVVTEFEIQSRYCVNFVTNNRKKRHESSDPPRSIVSPLFFSKDVFGIK